MTRTLWLVLACGCGYAVPPDAGTVQIQAWTAEYKADHSNRTQSQ